MFTRRQTNLTIVFGLLVIIINPTSYLCGDDNSRELPPGRSVKRSTVSGKVLMPDGQTPAAEADVHLLRRSSNGVYSLPVKTQRTATDADGRFRLPEIDPGQYKLWAETPLLTTLKKRLGGARVEVGEDGATVKVEPLTLHDGCNYRVKVISATTGKPLPSGQVQFGWTDLPRHYDAGADGVVEIGGLSVADWYFVVAAEGHATQFKKTPKQPLGSTTELEFTLHPGGEVVGTVRTDDGEPVANAKVSANSTAGGMTPAYGSMSTDSNGRFRFENLPIGVAIRFSAGKEAHIRASQEVVIPIGQKQASTKLVCDPRPYGGDCVVTLLNEEGQPIAGAPT